jgi:hypothetical protein
MLFFEPKDAHQMTRSCIQTLCIMRGYRQSP